MAADGLDYGQPEDDAEQRALFAVLVDAFGALDPDNILFVQHHGREQMRTVRAGGKVVAGALLLPFAHWFGGRAVPACGYNGVATAPEHRGSGAGRRLMASSLGDLHRDGVALASLYPSNPVFYGSLGFAFAGVNARRRLDALQLPRIREPLAIERLEGSWREIAEVLGPVAERRGVRASGVVARPPALWHRMLTEEEETGAFAFLAERGDPSSAQGFALVTYKGLFSKVICTDLCLLSHAALEAALSLLAGYGANPECIEYPVLPGDPVQQQVVSGDVSFVYYEPWMLRITGLREALEGRGYDEAVSETLELDLHDPLFEDHAGRWALSVAGGTATLRRGGRGLVRLDIATLASIYAGYLHPLDPVGEGRVRAEPSERARLARVFAGPTPYSVDFY